ncbi:MAG: hypothetical protein ABI718_17985 [Acidobacteriota bacterium]
MSDAAPAPSERGLSQLAPPVLEEVIRQLRGTRNDIIRYGVWNIRNISDEEFNRLPDPRLLGYFRQDLLETRFLSKGRRIDLVQLWNWFDDQLRGIAPLLVGGKEMFLNIQDKDLEKVRKRIEEIQSFFPTIRANDLDGFRRVKYKLRRTVMRLTYDLHHLYKRLEKYRKTTGIPMESRNTRVALEAVIEIPEPLLDETLHNEEPLEVQEAGT